MEPILMFIALLFSAATAVCAQDFKAPNLKQIEKDVKDKSTPYYYSSLLKKYSQGDSSLTLEEKRHLYYGYCFQPGYEPYGTGDGASDSARAIARKDSLTEVDYAKLMAFTETALQNDPFDSRMINYRFFAAKHLGRKDLMQAMRTQMKIMIDAIVSTGDGKSAKTAMWVIKVSDEYFIVDVSGFEFGGSQSLDPDGPCDLLTVKENEWGIEGLYFNVSISMSHMEKMLRGRK